MNIKKIAASAFVALALTAGTVAPASAADFAVTADKTSNLVALNDVVTVTLANLPANAGAYVRLCAGTLAEATAARPANCFGQGAWVSLSAVSKTQGATDATAPIKLSVQSVFTSGTTTIDCNKSACGIHVRRDHLAGTDFSLDRFIPVTFAAVVPEVKATATYKAGKLQFVVLAAKGEKVTFEVAGEKYVKKATSNKFAFELKFASKKKFDVAVSVDDVFVVEKTFKGSAK
jgi:hypothetical protein